MRFRRSTITQFMSTLSAEKPSPEDARLEATAFHEAGHAVMAALLGRPVLKVTIAPGQMVFGVRLGACELQKGRSKKSKDWLEDEVLILLAGMVAEAQLTGKYCQAGATQDLLTVRRLLGHSRATNPRQLERLEQRLLDKTEYMLGDPIATKAIKMIAEQLLEKKTLSGRAVRHWLEQAGRAN